MRHQSVRGENDGVTMGKCIIPLNDPPLVYFLPTQTEFTSLYGCQSWANVAWDKRKKMYSLIRVCVLKYNV